jgi:small subunit ribosomal protein S6
MPYYESVFIARQDISSAQVDTLADSFTSLIQEGGGQVTKKENWGLRNLTYRIKKNRKGHYVLLNIDSPSAAVLEMERNMRINEDVIRYLTVRVDELESEESIVLRSRGARDSGRGGSDFGRGGRDFGRGGRDFGRGGRDFGRGGRDGGRDGRRGGPPDRAAPDTSKPDASAPDTSAPDTSAPKSDSQADAKDEANVKAASDSNKGADE